MPRPTADVSPLAGDGSYWLLFVDLFGPACGEAQRQSLHLFVRGGVFFIQPPDVHST